MTLRPIRRLLRRLALDRAAVSMIEFALGMPILIGFLLGGLEMANYILASNTCQRLATMMADLVSQSGVGGESTTQVQIYDMFNAVDVSAKPYDLRNHGRVVFSVIKGKLQTNGTVRNEFAEGAYAQQFDGGFTGVAPVVGCRQTGALPALNRSLPADEMLVHVQVSYQYQPMILPTSISYFTGRTSFTRTAAFRMRKNQFAISGDAAHPAKSNCTTANGR
jgi:Flp pilus assembly protein TadG